MNTGYINNKEKDRSTLVFFLVAFTTAVGSLIYLGFASLYHLVVVFFLLLVLLNGIPFNQMQTIIIKFLMFWFLEAIISIIWAPDKGLALKYVYYIFLMLAICIIFHSYLNKNNVENYAYLMIFLLLISNIIAVWEMITGNHLIKEYLSTPERMRLLQYVPGVFYMNPNDFATFTILLLPFSLAYSSTQKKIISIAAQLNIFLTFVTAIATKSRTQIILIILFYIIYFVFTKKTNLLKIIVIGGIVFLILSNIYPDFKKIAEEAFNSISKDEIMLNAQEGSSLGNRIALLKNGFYILIDTLGFGIGAGCHRVVMLEYSTRYFYTKGGTVIHNLLGEIFVDYGIFIGIFFIVTVFSSVKSLFKIYRNNQNPNFRNLAFYLACSLSMFVLCGISSSSLLQLTSEWLTFCFISAFIQVCEINAKTDKLS